jgi:hypothetical protein
MALDPIFSYLLLPIILFALILLIWAIQSISLLFIVRKFIFPTLYRSKLTEWFIVEVSIAIHEISHLAAALFTGSEINLKESFVSSKGGRIAARTSQSIGGWISTVIAAFAPGFLPPIILLMVSIVLLQINIPFNDVLKANSSIFDPATVINIISSVISPILTSLINLIFNPSLQGIFLLYLIMISALTACPSEDDWKASLSILFSFSLIPLLVLFMFINYAAIQFNFNLIVFISVFLSFSIFFIFFGLILNFIFVILLTLLYRLTEYLKTRISRRV